MGGNALKKIKTRRYDLDEYDYVYEQKIKPILKKSFPESIFSRPRSISSKKTFGDIDIVISRDFLPDNWKEVVFKSFGSSDFYENFNSLKNPDIHPRDERNAFSVNLMDSQVDFILTNDKCFNYTVNQLSFGDASGFIGRVFSKILMHEDRFGLKKRLVFKGSETKILFNFSSDFDLNRSFIDYDPDTWAKGFSKEEDLFHYITSSMFFDVELFNPARFNSSQRLNLKKRDSTREFVEFCMSNYNNLKRDPAYSDEYVTDRINKFFPNLNSIEHIASVKYEASISKKMLFSHSSISKIAADDNFKTDKFMVFIKKTDFNLNNDSFNFFVASSSHDKILSYLKNRVCKFNSLYSANEPSI